jgi:hypothetical protein
VAVGVTDGESEATPGVGDGLGLGETAGLPEQPTMIAAVMTAPRVR